MSRLKDQEVGAKFLMLGTNINGVDKWEPVTLVSIDEGEYIIQSKDGVRVICDGYEDIRY
jgi:hypothetical protein